MPRLTGIRKSVASSFLLVILLIVVMFEGVFFTLVRQYYLDSALQDLTQRATASVELVNRDLRADSLRAKSRYLLETVSTETSLVEVLNQGGVVQLDSGGFRTNRKRTSADVTTALQGQVGQWRGDDRETGERILAVAMPLRQEDRVVGVLRFSTSLEGIYRNLNRVYGLAAAVGGAVVLIAFGISLWLAKRIVDPIEHVTGVAKKMAAGNLNARARKQHEDEVGHLAETLNDMAHEIVKSQQLKNEFISTVSHEIRTPLTSIKGWGETLVSGDLQDEEETRLGLQIILTETDRLIELVEDLLDVSKLQAGNMRLARQQVALDALVREVVQQFAHRAQAKQIGLDLHVPDLGSPIAGDANRLKQVLINLLDNALKFTPEQGTIHIWVEQQGAEVLITVADTGAGIAPDQLPHVTEKFYKGNERSPGSGLGLAICKEIVHLHGGRLQLESEPGEGTVVRVWLPR